MVGKTGFEPATSWSQTTRTAKLCYFPIYKLFILKSGALGGNRTPNLLVRSQTLYPIELRVHNYFFKKWWLRTGLNCRHQDFQSCALPTELQSHINKKWRFRRDLNPRSSAWQADVLTTTPRNQNQYIIKMHNKYTKFSSTLSILLIN